MNKMRYMQVSIVWEPSIVLFSDNLLVNFIQKTSAITYLYQELSDCTFFFMEYCFALRTLRFIITSTRGLKHAEVLTYPLIGGNT